MIEELADVLHFAVSHDIAAGLNWKDVLIEYNAMDKPVSLPLILSFLFIDLWGMEQSVTQHVLILARQTGVSEDELYNAYLAKNKENHKRVDHGY